MQLDSDKRRLSIAEIAPLLHIQLGDTVVLPDGRLLGFAEFGDPNGFPLLHFHGAFGSRLQAALFAEAAAPCGIRIIGLDRPGMGLSSPGSVGPRAWAQDVRAFADQLGLERFAVVGQSGGGIYACACGADPQLREHVVAVFLICGMLPATPREKEDQLPGARWTAEQAALRPWLGRMLAWLVRRTYTGAMRRGVLPEGSHPTPLDRQIACMPGLARVFGVMVQSGLMQGGAGAVADLAVFERELDFELGEIAAPVRSFHGATDRNVPLSLATRVISSVPDGQLTTFPDVGHAFAAKFASDIMRGVAATLTRGTHPV